MEIGHSRPNINEEDIERVLEVLRSGQLTNGSQVSEFEKELADYIGQKGGVATNSGHSALYLALLSLGQDNKSEVIIPSYVCIALLNAIALARLNPVVVDINERGYNISLNEIKKKINNKTKAIITPHMFGDPIMNIEEIVNLGVPIIEDCALSIGATIDGRKVGSFSELSIFSFYTTKVQATGQGGMVLSSSEEKLERMRDYLQYDKREHYRESFNLRMSDIHAVLGRSQLSRLDDFIRKRREIAKRYDDELRGINGIRIPERPKGSIYFRYILEVEDVDGFIEGMTEEGIGCAKPIFKPLHRYEELRDDYPYLNLNRKDFPNTERAFERCVSIPIYPALTQSEIGYAIKKILTH